MSSSEKAQSDIKKLKAKYNSQLSTLKELFTEWTEEDLIFTLQDADGDLELAIDRISEGHASQWGEVKTKKSKKEAAAANKVTLESSASNNTTSTTTPSYPTTTSYNNRSSTSYNSTRPSTHQKPHQRPLSTTTTSRQKPAAAATWQSKKPQTTTSDFSSESWNTKVTDGWGNSSGDSAWKPKETNNDNAWLDTPKKATTTTTTAPFPSSKTSNTSGAKSWASLLQTKEEPSVEAASVSPVKETEHALQKVDDPWLAPSTTTDTSSNQWDQPIQLPVKDIEEKHEAPHIQKEEFLISSAEDNKKDDVSLNFNNLSLEETVPETKVTSSHPSVADILNSVKQQPTTATNTTKSDANNTTTTSTNTFNVTSTNQQDTTENKQNSQPQLTQQQMLQQQQQQHLYQQQQYQQFGIQDYSNAFNNTDYGIYGNDRMTGNYYDQYQQKFGAVEEDSTTKSSTAEKSQQQSFPQIYGANLQQQQQHQSFYPYYYMPNQFNAYSPYGQHQQATNSFMSGRSNMYPTSIYGQQQQQQPKSVGTPTTATAAAATTASPYANSSPYNPSQQLYGGFNSTSHFDDFTSGSQFYGQQQHQFLNPQQQQYRGSSSNNNQQYWNQ